MRLLELEIHNVRGITHLRLSPQGENLVIYGPKGSGKSAVWWTPSIFSSLATSHVSPVPAPPASV